MRYLIMIAALSLLSCSKDKETEFNCEKCSFGIQLIRSNGDTLTKYFDYKDVRWVYGIPEDISDVCLYFDTTKSEKVEQFYIGRICE